MIKVVRNLVLEEINYNFLGMMCICLSIATYVYICYSSLVTKTKKFLAKEIKEKIETKRE